MRLGRAETDGPVRLCRTDHAIGMCLVYHTAPLSVIRSPAHIAASQTARAQVTPQHYLVVAPPNVKPGLAALTLAPNIA